MAERRMFSKAVVESDAFCDLPIEAQCLYFHLSMNADDDGVVSSPKKQTRSLGFTDKDLEPLITKRFILMFESGVAVIKHWKMNNYIQKDRYRKSTYQEELAQLTLDKKGSYTEKKKKLGYSLDTDCIQNGYSLDTDCIHRIGKDRLGKDRLVNTLPHPNDAKGSATNAIPEYDESAIDKCDTKCDKISKQKQEEWFNEFWSRYPKKLDKKKAHEKFLKIAKDEMTFNDILVGMNRTVIAQAKAEGTDFVPFPTTWLNGERWNDEPYKPKKKAEGTLF